MRKITISIDDEVYRQACIKAAEQNTSVSALVKAYLVHLTTITNVRYESEYDRLHHLEREIRARLLAAGCGLRPTENLPREALHDRGKMR